MSRRAAKELTWGDGKHLFRLGIGELEELDEKLDLGPPELWLVLTRMQWRLKHLKHVLQCALKGGGMAPAAAVALVERHLNEWPLVETAAVAIEVFTIAMSGHKGDQVGKKAAGEAASASASPASMASAQRSGTRRTKSGK